MTSRRLPSTGPLADLESCDAILAGPDAEHPRRPWVVATSERVLKAYDLSLLDAIDREPMFAEARIAVELGEIDGVVTTHEWKVDGDWLTIEMDRLDESVAGYLEAVRGGERAPLSAAQWGALIEDVARTLGKLHGRGVVHRDVKPGNLLFEQASGRLLVADFSISTRRPRRGVRRRGGGDGTDHRAGTVRYVAPEISEGRIGPAADQYALGVTARDVLGDAASASARTVLMRATEQDPADRYPSIADFGIALRAAVDDAAPRRLSSRMHRVAPKWRIGWAPGVAAFAFIYLALLWSRPPGIGWGAGLGVPLMLGTLPALLVTRMLSWLRAGRSQPRLAIADRGWFPVLVLALALGGFAPLLLDDRSLLNKMIFYVGLGSFWLAAILGSLPRDAGDRLIRVVRRWEHWREGHRGRPLRWWGGRALLVAILFGVSALPGALAGRWPGGEATGERARSLVAVAKLRAAMLAGRPGDVCELMRAPRPAGKARCREWAPLAGRWLREEVRRARAPRVTPDELGDVRLAELPNMPADRPAWRITTAEERRRELGTLEQEDATGKVWEVSITRLEPRRGVLSVHKATWNYEVIVRGPNRWITSVEMCRAGSADPCLRIAQIDRSKLPAYARRGPPR